MTGDDGRQDAVKLLNDMQDISLAQIALVLFVTWFIIFAARRILPFLAERGPSQLRLVLLGSVPVIRLGMMVLAVLWIVPLVFNVTWQNFLVIAGAASVAIGFAFKDYVSSLIAGIVAIFEKPYRAGDWVKVDSDYGEIRSVGLRAVKMVTADDNAITVPHSRLWAENISNANDGAQTLQCAAEFFLAPLHDAAAIRAALADVALSSAYLDYASPVVVVLTEKPWGTHYKLRAYPFDMRDQFIFIADMTVRGKQAVELAGGVPVVAMPAIDQAGSLIVSA